MIEPTGPRRAWLRWHAKRHPDHVLMGWNGAPLRCGTCMGIPNPELGGGFRYHMIPRTFVRYGDGDSRAEARMIRVMEKRGGKGFRILRSAEAPMKRYRRP